MILGIAVCSVSCVLTAVTPYYSVKFVCNRAAIDIQVFLLFRNNIWIDRHYTFEHGYFS